MVGAIGFSLASDGLIMRADIVEDETFHEWL
jgi:hypothetical protein